MRSLLNYTTVLFIVVGFVFPISEYLFTTSTTTFSPLLLYSFFNLIAIVIFFLLTLFFVENKKKWAMSYFDDPSSKFEINTLLVTLAGFVIFLVWFSRNLYSLIELLVFTEQYRNGFYQGSGIYTLLITQLAPVCVVYLLLKKKMIGWKLYLSIILIFLVTFILGLRIFIYPIILGIYFRSSLMNWNIKRILSGVVLFLILFVSFKFILNTDLQNNGVKDVIKKVVGRQELNSLLIPNFNNEKDIPAIPLYFPGDTKYNFNLETFKERFVKLSETKGEMTFGIINFSGVAIPALTYFFNYSPFLYIPIVVIFLCSLFILILFSLNQKVIIALLVQSFFIILFGFLFEDIFIYTKIYTNLICISIISVLIFSSYKFEK